MKKGFTLIELLAVIVILAIIALIATPIVIGIIKDAKEESNIRSAEIYIKSVELAVARQRLSDNTNYSSCTVQSTGNIKCNGTEIPVPVDNTTATSGTLTITDGVVTSVSDLTINNKTYSTDANGNLVATDNVEETSSVCTRGKEGSYDTITCGTETFYVMYESNGSITMLAKYNLDVGRYFVELDDDFVDVYEDIPNPTGIQSSRTIPSETGDHYDPDFENYGVVPFSETNYWSSLISSNSSYIYVYNENSTIYQYVEDYKDYLEDLGLTVSEARLMNYEEAVDLGCAGNELGAGDTFSAPGWVSSTSYWIGASFDDRYLWTVVGPGFTYGVYNDAEAMGVRPVIVIPSSMAN